MARVTAITKALLPTKIKITKRIMGTVIKMTEGSIITKG